MGKLYEIGYNAIIIQIIIHLFTVSLTILGLQLGAGLCGHEAGHEAVVVLGLSAGVTPSPNTTTSTTLLHLHLGRGTHCGGDHWPGHKSAGGCRGGGVG